MLNKKNTKLHKKVEEAFKFYESKGYRGHLSSPEIIEESKKHAEKIEENLGLSKGRGFQYVASLATFLACESHACSITLRMARGNSIVKIKTKNLHEARRVTGIKPKLKPRDWVDGIITTLKDRGVIKPGSGIMIKKQMINEIPKMEKKHTPRYRAIIAAYKALGDTGHKLSQEEMAKIFHISTPILNIKYKHDEIVNKVSDFLREDPERFYRPKDLVEILGLNTDPSGLAAVLSSRIKKEELDLLEFHAGEYRESTFFGHSPTCGPGYCLGLWCGDKIFEECRTGKKNPNLKFYKIGFGT